MKKLLTPPMRFCLMAILLVIVAVAGAVFVTGAKAPAFASYTKLSQENNWDAKIEEALIICENDPGSCVYENPEAHPEAYRIIYEMGPEAVPYILDRVEEMGGNTRQEMFLVAAANANLHLYEIEGTDLQNSSVAAQTPIDELFTPQYYARCLRALLHEVPNKVDDICDSKQTQEQKLKELDKLGMAALPYLAERIEDGEAEWKACFESQLIGLSVTERFDFLEMQLTRAPQEQIDTFYIEKQQRKKAVDVDKWIGDHAVTLDAVQYACER